MRIRISLSPVAIGFGGWRNKTHWVRWRTGILLWCRHKLGDDMDRLAEERRRGLPRGRLRGKMMLYYDIVQYPYRTIPARYMCASRKNSDVKKMRTFLSQREGPLRKSTIHLRCRRRRSGRGRAPQQLLPTTRQSMMEILPKNNTNGNGRWREDASSSFHDRPRNPPSPPSSTRGIATSATRPCLAIYSPRINSPRMGGIVTELGKSTTASYPSGTFAADARRT